MKLMQFYKNPAMVIQLFTQHKVVIMWISLLLLLLIVFPKRLQIFVIAVVAGALTLHLFLELGVRLYLSYKSGSNFLLSRREVSRLPRLFGLKLRAVLIVNIILIVILLSLVFAFNDDSFTDSIASPAYNLSPLATAVLVVAADTRAATIYPDADITPTVRLVLTATSSRISGGISAPAASLQLRANALDLWATLMQTKYDPTGNISANTYAMKLNDIPQGVTCDVASVDGAWKLKRYEEWRLVCSMDSFRSSISIRVNGTAARGLTGGSYYSTYDPYTVDGTGLWPDITHEPVPQSILPTDVEAPLEEESAALEATAVTDSLQEPNVLNLSTTSIDAVVTVVPTPTPTHQRILAFPDSAVRIRPTATPTRFLGERDQEIALKGLIPPVLIGEITVISSTTGLGIDSILLINYGTAIALSGWSVTTEDANLYTFDDYTIKASGYVRIHAGNGNNTEHDIYLGDIDRIFVQSGTDIRLVNEFGATIDQWSILQTR